MFAFSQKPQINLPSTNRGGIAGIFLLQIKLFNIVQYAAGESSSFFAHLKNIALFSFKSFISTFSSFFQYFFMVSLSVTVFVNLAILFRDL